MDNNEWVRPVHRNGSRIVTAIMEFSYILTERDEIIVHWLLRMVFFFIIQSLTTMWFISERDILIVHYLAKTRGWFEALQQRCHKLAF